MRKGLTQVVALTMAIAAIVNAQCFASCAMVSPSASDHACCPHHKSSGAPCSHSKAEIRGIATVAVSPVAGVVPAIPELLPPQFQISARVRPISGLSSPNIRTSYFVLRI
jgi:hypothetical protein